MDLGFFFCVCEKQFVEDDVTLTSEFVIFFLSGLTITRDN